MNAGNHIHIQRRRGVRGLGAVMWPLEMGLLSNCMVGGTSLKLFELGAI